MQQQSKYFNCCYHDANDMNKFVQFLLKLDKSIIMKHLTLWWKGKGCHDDESENDAMTTYRFSGSPRGYRCKRKWRERVMQGWWGAPDYEVPTCRWQGKRGATCSEQLRHGVNTSISYNTQHSFTGVVLGLYLCSVHYRSGSSSIRCRGSRRSRDVRSVSRDTWRR